MIVKECGRNPARATAVPGIVNYDLTSGGKFSKVRAKGEIA